MAIDASRGRRIGLALSGAVLTQCSSAAAYSRAEEFFVAAEENPGAIQVANAVFIGEAEDVSHPRLVTRAMPSSS